MVEKAAHYRSFYEVAKKIRTDEARLAFYMAIDAYRFDGIEPENLPFEADLAFTAIKANIDADLGRKNGGAPVGNQNARKQNPQQKKTPAQTSPKENTPEISDENTSSDDSEVSENDDIPEIQGENANNEPFDVDSTENQYSDDLDSTENQSETTSEDFEDNLETIPEQDFDFSESTEKQPQNNPLFFEKQPQNNPKTTLCFQKTNNVNDKDNVNVKDKEKERERSARKSAHADSSPPISLPLARKVFDIFDKGNLPCGSFTAFLTSTFPYGMKKARKRMEQFGLSDSDIISACQNYASVVNDSDCYWKNKMTFDAFCKHEKFRDFLPDAFVKSNWLRWGAGKTNDTDAEESNILYELCPKCGKKKLFWHTKIQRYKCASCGTELDFEEVNK